MSNCSQNCWIDWNSAVLCFKFKWLFHIGVWTFTWFVRPLLSTILCVCEIWLPRIQCITYFPARKKNKKRRCRKPPPPKKKKKNKKNTKKCITAPILKSTDDQKPETFFGLIVGKEKLFCLNFLHFTEKKICTIVKSWNDLIPMFSENCSFSHFSH